MDTIPFPKTRAEAKTLGVAYYFTGERDFRVERGVACELQVKRRPSSSRCRWWKPHAEPE